MDEETRPENEKRQPMREHSHLWPTDEEIRHGAEMLNSMICQRPIGDSAFPVEDDDYDIARAVLHHVREQCHGSTWNATPFYIAEYSAA